jgi:hypothetical protein
VPPGDFGEFSPDGDPQAAACACLRYL